MRIIIVIMIVTVIAYILVQVRKGWKLVDTINHPKRSAFMSLEEISYDVELFSFNTSDKIRLSAIKYKPNTKSKGTIIACHYLGGSKYSIYSFIEPLLEHGFTILSFDYPNHGESMDRKNSRYMIEDDMKQFIDELKRKGIQGPYGTFGFSMGAISAIDNHPEIKAIVTDSGPLLFVKDYFLYVLRNKQINNIIIKISFLFIYLYVVGFKKMSRRMIKRLKSMSDVPVMMIHSKKDRIIPYKNVLYAKELLNSDLVKIIPVENAHHLTNRIVLGKLYDDLVIEFFEKWLVSDES